MIFGVIGPIFGITSILYYLVVAIVAGGIGYWGYKKTPIAGVVSCILIVVLAPIVFSLYMSGRTKIVKIEFLIPIFLTTVPAYFVGEFIKKAIYP